MKPEHEDKWEVVVGGPLRVVPVKDGELPSNISVTDKVHRFASKEEADAYADRMIEMGFRVLYNR